jgi:hypothetical protein
VAVALAGNNAGCWRVGSDGGVFTYGRAPFYGSLGDTSLAAPIVGMAADPATGGYWLVGADGGVFSLHAPFYGSLGDTRRARYAGNLSGGEDLWSHDRYAAASLDADDFEGVRARRLDESELHVGC